MKLNISLFQIIYGNQARSVIYYSWFLLLPLQDLYEKARTYFDRSKDFDFQSLYMLSCMLYDGIGGDADEVSFSGMGDIYCMQFLSFFSF